MGTESWPKKTLNELVEDDSTITYGVVKPGPPGNVRFIRSGDVTGGRISLTRLRTISEKVSRRYERTLLRGGELLVALVGQPGATVVVPESLAGANIARQVGLVRLSSSVSTNFVRYFLSSRIGRQALLNQTLGSVQQVINLRDLKNVEVPLPPLPEQRKIAAILSSVDEAIEKTQAVIDQVQVVKKGLMQELLTRGLPGRHTRFKQTEIGEIPEGWEVLPLTELGEKRDVLRTGPFGSSLKTKDFTTFGRPVLTIQSLGVGEIEDKGLFYVEEAKAEELAAYKVHAGDLVFSRVADVGRSVVIPRRAEGWIVSSNLMRIRTIDTIIDPRYLMYTIVGSTWVISQIERLANNAGRQVVSSPVLKKLFFPVPPMEEQRHIANILESVEERTRQNKSHGEVLKALKRSLMSVLLTGEVRVNVEESAP